MRIGPNTLLPADRRRITLTTADGERLAGELALPQGPPRATVVIVHPNPTGGGSMDTHVIHKAAARLPALAGIATLRFNTRGTASESGTSTGTHDGGVAEAHDLAAALDFVADLPNVWLAGWSFGTDVVLMRGLHERVHGAFLLAPTMRRTQPEHLAAWAASGKPVRCVVPELDDYLRPAAAADRFAALPQAEIIPFPSCKHLFVGFADQALDSLVDFIAPDVPTPLSREWPDQTAEV
ncbi:alpha/beta superfamily hydrolase [Actinokineospora baliensis]|uniref:alpha/beta hydrolase n=1 Tax=Actinokineospora baliensis TaxID=547056 RepID=UPI0027DC5D3A|nr:alpha/beta hydrolase [Actinokineospora baliensis]MBM7772662.1 alpha/beta superfamily hydrolase [Actinokineospora baliensis]